MRVADEFRIRSAEGHVVILQKVAKGISYLDFGMTHLPRDFEGYRVKYTDRIAVEEGDGAFRLSGTDKVYHRV
ncbi:hypothetical protein GCM10007205_20580 [Oxalicibacterium flavum]|uniref:Uncharacterized protein n=1 Tax=Oxalicibacterium flavum TaxID=179467 RepID=A0A8J2XXH3_9BURK|nr:hypothetical protein [Oxalicibacterium flavum]GGC11324.1 hypothetical protein GCM10007205_20580 [Oxalicibacterium flavum]